MGILSRVVNMTKAAANELLDKVENPALMMNQYLREVQEQIAYTESQMTEAKMQQRVLQSKLDNIHGQITFYHEKAEQAALDNREIDARTAIEAKILYQEQYDEVYRVKLITAQTTIELEQRIDDLKEEYDSLQNKRSELSKRLDKVNAASPLAGHIHSSLATQGFNRIEQKIMELEARQELTSVRSNYGVLNSDPNATPQSEARQQHIEQELQRLMQKQESQATV